MIYYHVSSFIGNNHYPTVSQLYKTKNGAVNAFNKRMGSKCYDRIVLWKEDTSDKYNGKILMEVTL